MEGIVKELAYYNGEIGSPDEMKVPFNDRVHWFGDGVYDATCCANHVVFLLDEHMDRFFKSAEMLEISLGASKRELADLMRSLSAKVDSPNQFVYWQATRGGGATRAHEFQGAGGSNLWAMIRPAKPVDVYEKIALITVPDTRYLHCDIKTLNLLPNVMASEKAKRAGCAEAVMHRDSRVTENAHSNVSILKGGVLRTAPADNLILAGVARAHLIRHCGELGVPVDETPFTVREMMEADEVITSSASTFCLSAKLIDGQPVGGRAPELLKAIQDAVMAEFRELTGAGADGTGVPGAGAPATDGAAAVKG
jgi:D-alanine transaminase